MKLLRGVTLILCITSFPAVPVYAATKYCAPNAGAVAVDVSEPVSTTFLDKVKEVGVSTIIRYYDYDPPTLPQKTLHRSERDLILSRGFSIAAVFQHWNNKFSSFTPARGKGDAERSLVLANENLQPSGGVIYFGVDGSWGTQSELTNIREYFQAVTTRLCPSIIRWVSMGAVVSVVTS